MDDWMTADEAAHALGVTRATLYAYVSRGLLRSAPTPGARQSRYRRHEVLRLALQRRRARKPALVARATLDWGRPVLSSALTLIEDGGLYYRGRDAIALAREAALEDVAALLWACEPAVLGAGTPPRVDPAVLRALAPLDPVRRCTAGFAWLQGRQGALPDAAAECTRLLRLMTAVVTRRAPTRAAAHQQLARAWRLDAHGAGLLRQALVLCADHELNASGFAARCVASTGAELGACVTAGLAALSGSRHCGITAQIEALWDDTAGRRGAALARTLDRHLGPDAGGVPGQIAPGFGHLLYPDGDPRAGALLAALPARDRHERLLDTVFERSGLRPSIDYALVALRRSLGLPAGHAYLLFALGRTVGWLAHALEQGRSEALIRPRAAYVGERPASAPPAATALPSRIIRRR
ncbi:MAG: helix-turn-helix domain-containing protein [Comamonadaceae bacterium]|nr:helix-turn-helix domain-containing protein [Comamonadaceae bacterium]